MQLTKLSEQLQKSISNNNYDYIVFTDGSGSTIDLPIGYAILAVDIKNNITNKYVGYISNGTVNQSELLGICTFLQVLEASGVKQGKLLVVSDSEVTVKCGNKQYARNANKGLWALLDYYTNNGFIVDFTWVRRNSNEYNSWCDKQSKEIRQRFKNDS